MSCRGLPIDALEHRAREKQTGISLEWRIVTGMPVMDGVEFIKQLPGVANAKSVPVVMITSRDQRGVCPRTSGGVPRSINRESHASLWTELRATTTSRM
jgi:DNA-binding NarL/FixJ family response regulator